MATTSEQYIETGLWLYDSTADGYKGENYSYFVQAGDQFSEDITDEIDTAQITILGLTRAKEFTPETKFIYEKATITKTYLENGEVEEERTVLPSDHHDICVKQDTVTKSIISDDGYYDHHIAFCEPAVVAQKRVVDNISATYKLQDVSLQERASVDTSIDSQTVWATSQYVPSANFGQGSELPLSVRLGKYFAFSDIGYRKSGESAFSTKLYLDVTTSTSIDIRLPAISIYTGVAGGTTFTFAGYASLDYNIVEKSLNGEITNSSFASGTIHSNSTFDNAFQKLDITASDGYRCLIEGYTEYFLGIGGQSIQYATVKRYSQATDSVAMDTVSNRTIQITPNKNRIYEVVVSVHNYTDYENKKSIIGDVQQIWVTDGSYGITSFAYAKSAWFVPTNGVLEANKMAEAQTSCTFTFQTYTDGDLETIYESAVPYSAWRVLQKAILNTGAIRKVTGTKVYDTPTAFYIDEQFVDELKNTEVVENFYNEKNLWEICLDIGKYIHAVPRIEFGTDDRFKITFDRLGVVDESESKTTQLTVMNFNGVENYISACSSYISNMVQIDGINEEYLAPKSTSEDYIVSNNDCCLITAKPLLEIVDLDVTYVGSSALTLNGESGSKSVAVDTTHTLVSLPRNLTAQQQTALITANPSLASNPSGFVFEENIYKVLDNSFVNVPNKGVAMYYTLGDNKIRGWDYRSTTKSGGDRQNDYAIKKILYYAFYGSMPNTAGTTNYWANLKINDFVFHITYRTKDSLRQEQSRPDLRKYLLNSKHDTAPTHKQFNNQEDVVVDSVKFGNNIYGKLIRTGNTEYKQTEWCENLTDCKHKGELYRIDESDGTFGANGNLYYVAKADHTYYGEHIVSVITYSKDYNQLSPVIGIPSEPRFYEISEQSSIKREFVISDYLMLCSDDEYSMGNDTYLNLHITPLQFLQRLIAPETGQTPETYPKYAMCTFKDDSDAYGDANQSGQVGFHKDVMLPLSAYSSENTLTFEWDCVNNFSANDKVQAIPSTDQPSDVDKAYKTLVPVQYTNRNGRAQLFDFYILGEKGTAFTTQQIQAFPESIYTSVKDESTEATAEEWDDEVEYVKQENAPTVVSDGGVKYLLIKSAPVGTPTTNSEYWQPCKPYIRNQTGHKILFTDDDRSYGEDVTDNDWGLVLLKDNREVISANYNLQMLTSSDTFVLSPFLFKAGKTNVKFVLLNKEVNKLSNGYINLATDAIFGYNFLNQPFTTPYKSFTANALLSVGISYLPAVSSMNIGHFNGTTDYEQVKAVAMVYDIADLSPERLPTKAKFVMARNIPSNLTVLQKLAYCNFYIKTLDKNATFTNKQ